MSIVDRAALNRNSSAYPPFSAHVAASPQNSRANRRSNDTCRRRRFRSIWSVRDAVLRRSSSALRKAAAVARRSAHARVPNLLASDQPMIDGLPQRLADEAPLDRACLDQVKDGPQGAGELEPLRGLHVAFRAAVFDFYPGENKQQVSVSELKKLALSATKCNHRLVRVCSSVRRVGAGTAQPYPQGTGVDVSTVPRWDAHNLRARHRATNAEGRFRRVAGPRRTTANSSAAKSGFVLANAPAPIARCPSP